MIKIPKEKAFTVGDHIKPIPINKYRKNRHLISKQVTLSGWGVHSHDSVINLGDPLMKVDQILVNNVYWGKNAGFDGWRTWTKFDPDRYLFGSQLTGSGGCLGDSGGN